MVKRLAPWVLKGGISIGLIVWVLSKVHLATAWEQAKSLDADMLLAAVALSVVQIVLGAVRWGIVLRALSATFATVQTLIVYYIGVFFSMVLPGAVGGDAMRMWFARRAGMSLAAAVNSVMLERAVTVLGLVLLVAGLQPLLLARAPTIPGTWVFPVLSVLGVICVFVLAVLDRLPMSFRRWRLVRGLAQLAADTRLLFFRPRFGLSCLVVAIIGHVNLSLSCYMLAVGLHLPIDAVDCLVLIPPVILVMTLPISIAGWGLRETAMVTAFGFIGLPQESALVLSILFGILGMATALPGGLVFLLSSEYRTPRAVVEADQAEA